MARTSPDKNYKKKNFKKESFFQSPNFSLHPIQFFQTSLKFYGIQSDFKKFTLLIF
jgi:hypothetical protein